MLTANAAIPATQNRRRTFHRHHDGRGTGRLTRDKIAQDMRFRPHGFERQ